MGSESPILDYAGPQKRRPRDWLDWRRLAWGLPLAVVMVVTGLAILVEMTSSATPLYMTCLSNLRQIAIAVIMYQQDHGGAYPPTLAETYPYARSSKCYVCPQSGDVALPGRLSQTQPASGLLTPGACSYIYLGATLSANPPKSSPPAILLYERQPFHSGKTCIAYTDGTARIVDTKEMGYILSELAAGRNPPRKR